jgi:hypothetical protein
MPEIVRGNLLAGVLLLGVGVAGCVSVPPVNDPPRSEREALRAHVEFLSQPALKGRKPGSLGSRAARQYIESRFQAAGLLPWAETKDYVLPFGYGKNIVGVLPGTDPNLANEIVLVSAHYDHLGKDNQGRICPGAADNASGVAAVLEIARQLGAQPTRPKRSVAFAAFDCEEMMLLGSFAFTCRKDVQQAKIVAVVNADMLGRNLLDVVTNTIFVAGTEECPLLGEQVCQFGTNAGIRVLRLGTDLIGPRSDHVAFQSRGVPCLFFSCGTCRDYHQPTDTADKLDFNALEHSTRLMRATVNELASGAPSLSCFSVAREVGNPAPMLEELRSVCTLLNEVGEHRQEAGIKKEDADAFQNLASQARKLLNDGHYDRQARSRMIVDATGILVPYFLPSEPGHGPAAGDTQMRLALQYLQAIYLSYGPQMMEGYRGLVEQLLKFRPGPIHGMPAYQYEIYDIPSYGFNFRTNHDGKCALNVMLNRFRIKAETKPTKWLIKGFRVDMVGFYEGMDCAGSLEQVLDYCLLRMRGEQTNAPHFVKLQKVWERVGGSAARDYSTMLAARLQAGQNETTWLVGCIQSDCPQLALAAIGMAGEMHNEQVQSALCSVIRDTKNRPDVRAAAITSIRKGNPAGVRALQEVVGDATTAFRPEYEPLLCDDYPFAGQIEIRTLRPIFEKQMKDSPTASKTVGELAKIQLKRLGVREVQHVGADVRRLKPKSQRDERQ